MLPESGANRVPESRGSVPAKSQRMHKTKRLQTNNTILRTVLSSCCDRMETVDYCIGELLELKNEGKNTEGIEYQEERMEGGLNPKFYTESGEKYALYKLPTTWNAFLDKVLEIMEKKEVFRFLMGPAIVKLVRNDIIHLGKLGELDMDASIFDLLPPELTKVLKGCIQVLLEQKNGEALFSDENLSENSRLVVEKETNEITKISYFHDYRTSDIIWERGDSASHNLEQASGVTDVNELVASIFGEEASALSNGAPLDCDTNINELIASVRGQFNDKLLSVQIAAIKDKTLWKKVNDISRYGENRGEMVLQQAVYPPFTLVLLAAASEDCSFVYVADQDALSSSHVWCNREKHVLCGQPDAGLLLESGDPLAEIEIKPSTELNHQDLSKCILWSSITGQALQDSEVPRSAIALPFLIGSGFQISLFVTTFPYEDQKYRPKVTCLYPHVSLLNDNKRIRVFVDFVRIVGNMKKIACENARSNQLWVRKKAKNPGYKNLFSIDKNDKDKDDHKDGDKGSGSAGVQGEPMQVDSEGNNERRAMMAVSQVCPAPKDLRFPWQRYRNLFDEEPTSYFQQRSPFFFRGLICKSLAFFKVWRLGDADVEESFIRDEVRLLKHALDAGVSVPSILHQGFTDVNGSRYFVLAMEDAGSENKVGSYDELVSYSLSLLQNTKLLHSAAGVLHCDLKPDNIVWNADRNEIVLVDFGHAQEQEKSSCVRGTEGFTAVEVDHGKANTRASDAYGVGATLRFLLKEVPGPDQLGIRALVDALTTAAPNDRISLDEAHKRLVAAQMERDHPSTTEHHSKKMKTGPASNCNCSQK